MTWFIWSWKSTFLRSLNYLETPDSGTIQIDNFKVDFSKISQEDSNPSSQVVYGFSNSLICLNAEQLLTMSRKVWLSLRNYRTMKQQKSLRKSWPGWSF